ncbi:MAG TPA: hypothetical protein VHE34_29745 [Puia sp.]|uniref:hypothetical protein n=1 Tax=Puia sp. TaxID=2045100 RepID=UPI002C17BDB2|nr:hypothetical protein [Puia sp.]HVU99455.1 hypothetical protein [Puia sp.]
MAKLFLLVATLLGISLLPGTVAAQKPAAAQTPTAKPAATPKPTPAKTTQNQTPTQSKPYPITAADSAIHFADSIFHNPSLLYQIVQPDIPADIQSILVRFNNALVANRDWFQQYRAAYAGKPLPYNQRFGINPEEYKRLQNLEQAPPQLVPIDTQKVTVTREAGYLRFTTDGDIRLLDYFQIDLQNNFVMFAADTIPLAGRTVTTALSPYGQWEGYTWRLQKADAAQSLATGHVTARVVEVNLGLTPPEAETNRRKVFLRLKYQDMVNGEAKANLELVGYLLQ